MSPRALSSTVGAWRLRVRFTAASAVIVLRRDGHRDLLVATLRAPRHWTFEERYVAHRSHILRALDPWLDPPGVRAQYILRALSGRSNVGRIRLLASTAVYLLEADAPELLERVLTRAQERVAEQRERLETRIGKLGELEDEIARGLATRRLLREPPAAVVVEP